MLYITLFLVRISILTMKLVQYSFYYRSDDMFVSSGSNVLDHRSDDMVVSSGSIVKTFFCFCVMGSTIMTVLVVGVAVFGIFVIMGHFQFAVTVAKILAITLFALGS